MARQVLELSIALSDNVRTQPIIEGRVAPEGIRLVPTAVHPSEMFWRQLKFQEFDVSEMSISSYTIATSQGPTPWVALPIYTGMRDEAIAEIAGAVREVMAQAVISR